MRVEGNAPNQKTLSASNLKITSDEMFDNLHDFFVRGKKGIMKLGSFAFCRLCKTNQFSCRSNPLLYSRICAWYTAYQPVQLFFHAQTTIELRKTIQKYKLSILLCIAWYELRSTLIESYPKMSHLNSSILAFSTNFCPIKIDNVHLKM